MVSTILLPTPLAGVEVEAYGEPPVSYAVAKAWEQSAFTKGHQEAEAFAQRQIVEMRNEFLFVQETLFKRIEEQFQEVVSTVGRRVPDVVLAIVRRLWGGLELTPATVQKNLQDLMHEISPDGEQLEIVLGAEDLALLKESDKEAGEIGGLAQHKDIVLVEDSSLQKGDCLIRSRFGTVDGRIETKLKKVEEELHGL